MNEGCLPCPELRPYYEIRERVQPGDKMPAPEAPTISWSYLVSDLIVFLKIGDTGRVFGYHCLGS